MAHTAVKFVLLLVVFVSVTSAARSFNSRWFNRGPIKCPSGTYLHNDDTKKVIIDERTWVTCTNWKKRTCVEMTYTYRLPCKDCQGDKVSGKTYIPCENYAETESWIGYYTNKEATESGLPFGAKYISSGFELCNKHPCFDFTAPALGDLKCNLYGLARDRDSGEIIPGYQMAPSIQQCKSFQTNCHDTEIYFTSQETGQRVTLYGGGCHDDYNFWYDRYYPHVSSDKNYCANNGCEDFEMTGCLCYGENKINGKEETYKETLCSDNLCNKKE